MKNGNNGESVPRNISFQAILITAVVFSLPVIRPEFGWLNTFVPLPVFYCLVVAGPQQGASILAKAMLIAGICALLASSIPSLLFSFTFLPAGFMLAWNVNLGKSIEKSGLQAVLVTIGAWLLFWMLYGFFQQGNPFQEMLDSIDQVIVNTQNAYDSSRLPEQNRQDIETAFGELRRFIPRMLPALATSTIIFTIWLNMLCGHWLLKRRQPDLTPWPSFRDWRLPDTLVWGVIIAIGGLVIPVKAMNVIGANLTIIATTLYLIQGLAVFSSFLHRWAVPLPLRIMVYGLVLIQAFGIILLAILGLADIWVKFNRIQQTDEDHPPSV